MPIFNQPNAAVDCIHIIHITHLLIHIIYLYILMFQCIKQKNTSYRATCCDSIWNRWVSAIPNLSCLYRGFWNLSWSPVSFYSGSIWATWYFDLSSPLLGVYYCLTQQFGIKGHISEEGDWKKEVMCLGLADPELTVTILTAKVCYRHVQWMLVPAWRYP